MIERDPEVARSPPAGTSARPPDPATTSCSRIDRTLQYQVERALMRPGRRAWAPRAASPSSAIRPPGEILAMANIGRVARRRGQETGPAVPIGNNRGTDGRVRAGLGQQGDHDGRRARGGRRHARDDPDRARPPASRRPPVQRPRPAPDVGLVGRPTSSPRRRTSARSCWASSSGPDRLDEYLRALRLRRDDRRSGSRTSRPG